MRDTTWPLVGTKFQSSSVEKYFTSERPKREISYLEAAMYPFINYNYKHQ